MGVSACSPEGLKVAFEMVPSTRLKRVFKHGLCIQHSRGVEEPAYALSPFKGALVFVLVAWSPLRGPMS